VDPAQGIHNRIAEPGELGLFLLCEGGGEGLWMLQNPDDGRQGPGLFKLEGGNAAFSLVILAGAGAGIAYLLTRDLRTVNHTIVNTLAISSGIVCDGAKASCAAKIAMAVDAGIMGFDMHMNGCQFYGGDGLVSKGVENTIRNISALGSEGMKETDKKIIQIMTGC
jgi:hypothetical protein